MDNDTLSEWKVKVIVIHNLRRKGLELLVKGKHNYKAFEYYKKLNHLCYTMSSSSNCTKAVYVWIRGIAVVAALKNLLNFAIYTYDIVSKYKNYQTWCNEIFVSKL